ncbi:MAG TPA: hypothetical protein VHJ69_10235 [Gemmatimonadales bacterium]|nr:hypothetical protein [Gemmatimonadales bacterium]
MPRLSLLLFLALAGCEASRETVVRVVIPGPDSVLTPVSGLGLVALPYDRDSVLRALEARARSPRPATAELDSLFARFRGPFAAYSRAAFDAGRLRDSLATLKRRLDGLSRNAPEYRQLYAEFARLSEDFKAVEAREAETRKALDAARGTFVSKSDPLRARVRAWEDTTYMGYDSIVRGLTERARRPHAADTTDATGHASLTLVGGPWWIYARSWDATDPNSEWYWNVPVTGDTVLLDARSGRRRPRY